MCANTLLWAGAGAALPLLIFCARSVPAQICITHIDRDHLDLCPGFPKHRSLYWFGKVIPQHFLRRAVVYRNLSRGDSVLDKELTNVYVFGSLAA
jgi:hypothetical protein